MQDQERDEDENASKYETENLLGRTRDAHHELFHVDDHRSRFSIYTDLGTCMGSSYPTSIKTPTSFDPQHRTEKYTRG
jgi:hypothetical protein